jgi:hypothetical protein
VNGKQRASIGVYLLVVVAFAAGCAAIYGYHIPTVTHTRLVKQTIQSQYGKPTQSIPGATVNAALAKLTCDVWQSKGVVVCHP